MSLRGDDLNTLCSPSFLEGLGDASVVELRERRDACQRAEAVLSYLRRVLQGELDLVVAEIELRSGSGTSDVGRLVEELPTILASGVPRSGGGSGRGVQGIPEPVVDDASLEELLADLIGEDPADETRPGGLLAGANLCTFSQAELINTLERLRTEEALLSSKRRILHEHIDAIQAAIVDRYKTGAADPDSLLS